MISLGSLTRSAADTGSKLGLWARIAIRALQFIFAITVAGLYGTDLANAQKANKYADSKWVYAEVVAALSAITVLVYLIPFIKTWIFFIWDVILFILWTAVFGVFGQLYINEKPEGNGGIQRMKNAVWIDLINMLLWFVTACYGAFLFFFHRRRTLHTGRAVV
ncbi:hypothetical protein W97_04954 [Coniosporium apollinis CBS 100218]|uniref:MARVEL domain-containing protein n=1 Tax=Coniosporium apollinis (strain CBS 100218) TaxID=1168221 RepID=R7YUW3_CONA1|nr:uncharacterized protein W97_04954 [Coniosporium apollinis CBS 100218]EON65715.1 hypothetical protein W97_04954 [Coniosporium apollinis CBS 100218]